MDKSSASSIFGDEEVDNELRVRDQEGIRITSNYFQTAVCYTMPVGKVNELKALAPQKPPNEGRGSVFSRPSTGTAKQGMSPNVRERY